MLCVCGCRRRVNNSKFVCTACRRLFSSSCKNSRDGICAFCLPASTTSPQIPTVSFVEAAAKRALNEDDDTQDEVSTTQDESSSATSSSIYAAERRMEKRMDCMMLAFQKSMEAQSRMFSEVIKSTEVFHFLIY